ncbi:SDR family NAD(P)-dependent oxidoreductase [Rhodoligotrophos defluvii]|uniref:SDR family NAD(P)-dependent oxidoreductase n=1 Tax=Rhodoligotrophos defluvii TaxID=2561934 RepID=UPI0010C99A82|nr:SDR family oxidoreductase [Rhodoligotrophos defluvii]
MKRLAGKAFVITGAGSGIGQSSALRLAEEGAGVLAVDQSIESVNATAAMAREGSGRIIAFQQDITAADGPKRMLGAAIQAFGDVDGIVNNAGIGAAKSAHLTTDEEFDRFMDVNLRALFRLSRDFILERRRKGGIIVNLASVFGLTGYPGSAPYSATKAAVIGLTRQMAADYGRDGFRVNAVAPGMIMTPIHSEERQKSNPEYYRSFVNGTPMGVTADASVIASAIAYLCSDDAKFVSGHVLVVDGGWLSTKRDLPVEETPAGYHFA